MKQVLAWQGACLLGLGLLCATSATAQLRDGVSVSDLQFVGAVEDGNSVRTMLSQDDVALLVAAREPISLNRLITGGIPVQSSRIQQLMNWGLLRQVGAEFQSLLPVLRDDRADAFASVLEQIAPAITDDVAVAIAAVNDRVWRHPGVPSLPVLTSWILRERAWDKLSGSAGIDIRRYVNDQREYLPDRGFWGLLWYAAEPPEFPYEYYSRRTDEYTVLVSWSPGVSGDPFAGENGSSTLTRFLDRLERDGRRLDDVDEFPGLVEAGLVESNGDLRALAREFRLSDRDGLGWVVEQAAADIATSFLSRVPRESVAAALGGVSGELAVTLTYMYLVPGIVAELSERGLPVTVGHPAAVWRSEQSTEDSAVRVAIRGAGDSDAADALPPFSLMIWKKLPRQPLMELPW